MHDPLDEVVELLVPSLRQLVLHLGDVLVPAGDIRREEHEIEDEQGRDGGYSILPGWRGEKGE